MLSSLRGGIPLSSHNHYSGGFSIIITLMTTMSTLVTTACNCHRNDTGEMEEIFATTGNGGIEGIQYSW